MNNFLNKIKNNKKGMTMIEVVFVLGIFTAISATILFNYRDFSNNIKLHNLSQEIALLGKRAQTFASQGRRPTLSGAQATNPLPFNWVSSYGVAFDYANHPKSIFFYFNRFDNSLQSPDDRELWFEDIITNYNGCGFTDSSECLEEVKIVDGSYIGLICINSEPQTDPDCAGGVTSNQLHVSFTRPFLESYILDDNLNQVSHAFVKVFDPSGTQKRYVVFWSTGQIGVY